MKRVVVSKPAQADLEEIVRYIASDSRVAAMRTKQRLLSAMHKLAEHPDLGRARPDLTSADALFWPVAPYWILYWPVPDCLYVLRVLYSARDIRGVLGE